MPDLQTLTQPLANTSRSLGGLKIETVNERPPWLNIFLYGDPGVGKTVLAGSASEVPEMSPVLFVDCEGGTYSLRTFHPDVEVVRVKDIQELLAVYTDLTTTDHGFKTIVLDSLSEINKMCMANIMRGVLEEDDERDPDVPQIKEWGKLGEQMRRIVRRFRDIDAHVIFTSLSEEVEQKGNKKKTYPMMNGKFRKEVAGFMDMVLYCYTKIVRVNAAGELDPDADEANHRFVLSSSTDEFVCKDRSARLPQIMLDPNMTHIYNLIQGE